MNAKNISIKKKNDCKEYGHVVSYCKKSNNCVNSKKTGHIIIECRLKPQRKDLSKTSFRAYQAVADEPKLGTAAEKS